MRFLADENFDARIVELLRAAGHDVAEVRYGHGGSDDQTVLALARRARRVLLTATRISVGWWCARVPTVPA